MKDSSVNDTPLYLVTGGAGFIGSHIVETLVRSGKRVRVLDNFTSGKRENIKDVLDHIELVEGDIRDEKLLDKVVSGVHYILHQAALRSAPKSVSRAKDYDEVNVRGTLNILEAARVHRVKRVVFASSSSVYGDSQVFPQHEKLLPSPQSPYGLTKLAGEHYCRLYAELHGVETVSLRYFNVFGERQDLENEYAVVIPKFAVCIMKGDSPPIHGDGQQSRDFTYIANVVHANLMACTARGVAGEVFNVACGDSHSVLELVSEINKILRKNVSPIFIEPRLGDPRKTWADMTRAKELLGFREQVLFYDGLRRTVAWFKDHYRSTRTKETASFLNKSC